MGAKIPVLKYLMLLKTYAWRVIGDVTRQQFVFMLFVLHILLIAMLINCIRKAEWETNPDLLTQLTIALLETTSLESIRIPPCVFLPLHHSTWIRHERIKNKGSVFFYLPWVSLRDKIIRSQNMGIKSQNSKYRWWSESNQKNTGNELHIISPALNTKTPSHSHNFSLKCR